MTDPTTVGQTAATAAATNIYDQLGLTRTAEQRVPKKELGSQDFLTLMLTQLKYQDPNSPMDPDKMAAQFSEMSMVTGMTEMKQAVDDLKTSMVSNQALQAAGLVGHKAMVATNQAFLDKDVTVEGQIALSDSATGLTLDIKDSNGALVRQITLGTQPKGGVSFQWDGKMADGSQAPPGSYQITAQGTIGGKMASPSVAIASQIESVNLLSASGGTGLTVNLRGGGASSPLAAFSAFQANFLSLSLVSLRGEHHGF
ncbi:flagellar basal-body rod modification protein FlgD [Gammaproteobacteria bacterium]